MQKLTMNTNSGSYVDGGDKERNLQAIAEGFGGLASGEGVGTWTASTTLTISDTRVVSTSKIFIGAVYGSNAKVGLSWRVSSRSAGSFTITSDSTETAGCTFWYSVIN